LILLPILWQIHLISVEVKITVAEQFGQLQPHRGRNQASRVSVV